MITSFIYHERKSSSILPFLFHTQEHIMDIIVQHTIQYIFTDSKEKIWGLLGTKSHQIFSVNNLSFFSLMVVLVGVETTKDA